MEEMKWKSPFGADVYIECWRPVQGAKGVVLLAHGLGEHIGRYTHVIDAFTANGFAVLANDHHGHGKTTGKRGHANGIEAFYTELDHLMSLAGQYFQGLPVYLYGHSMGGLTVIGYLVEKKPNVAGLISTGAALKLSFEPPKFLVFVGKLTLKIMPSFTQHNQVNPANVSRDPQVVEKYVNDPLVTSKLSSALGLSILDKGHELVQYHGAMPCPVLLMHGSDDKLTSPEGSRQFARNVTGDVEFKEWAGLYHEIHNEPEQKEVIQYMTDWLNRKNH